MNLKKFFIVVTGEGNWGKGETLGDAMKNARLKSIAKKKDCQIQIYIGVCLRHTTDEQMKTLQTLWGCNAFGSVMQCDDVTKDEQQLINDLFVGWIVDNSFM